MRRSKLIIIGAVAMLLASACSGNGDDASTAEQTSDELTPITVGVMPIVDTAPIWLGVDEGIFEKHGLDVTLEVAQGGAAIVPAVVSGDYEFGFSNVVSLLVASDQGLPLKIVAPGASTTGDTSSDFGAVLASPDSGIESAADLAGKKVAVNTLSNIGDVTVSEVVELDGGNPDDVDFVEMGFPDMPAALGAGQVDAIWVLEPFSSIAQAQGAKVVSYNYAETDPELPIAVYFTTEENAQAKPEIVASFTAAMTESLDFAQENPDETRKIMQTYTEIDEDIREQLVLPRFPSELNIEATQTLADLALKHGLVESAVDVTDIIQ